MFGLKQETQFRSKIKVRLLSVICKTVIINVLYSTFSKAMFSVVCGKIAETCAFLLTTWPFTLCVALEGFILMACIKGNDVMFSLQTTL